MSVRTHLIRLAEAHREIHVPTGTRRTSREKKGRMSSLSGLALLFFACGAAQSSIGSVDSSIFAQRPPDPRALDASSFGAIGDGITDDTLALQRAINATYASGTPDCSQPGARVVMVEGNGKRYRITATVNLWMWVRVIGWGATRPLITLDTATPGFTNASSLTALLRVLDAIPSGPTCQVNTHDGGNTAFGVGVLNVDISIAASNPGAVGVRNRAAQGGILRSMRFDLAADTAAGVHSPGWAHEDLHFIGGRAGVLVFDTGAWPSIFRDCVFDGQLDAGVAWDAVSEDANARSPWEGVTLIRGFFSDAPAAVNATGLAQARITVINSTFTRLSAAVVRPPLIAQGNSSVVIRDSGGVGCPVIFDISDFGPAVVSPGGALGAFTLTSLIAGRVSADARAPNGSTPEVRVAAVSAAASSVPGPSDRDTPDFPPVASWISVTDHGVVGDGETDNSVALNSLLASSPEGTAIFFPLGVYLFKSTIHIDGGKVLFGLSCWDVVLSLADGVFTDPDALTPFVHVSAAASDARGLLPWLVGVNIRTGINFGVPQPPPVPTGWYNPNPGAVALLWEAASGGAQDVFFHPHTWPDNSRVGVGPNSELSLVIADGGGGVFSDVWTCNSYSASGVTVRNTTARIIFYQLSTEHHAGRELDVQEAADVTVHVMQTEDRSPDAAPTASITLANESSIVVSGLFSYYAANVTSAGAIEVDATSSARVDVFRQWHSYHPMFYNCSLLVEIPGGGSVCVTAKDYASVGVSAP